MDLESSVSSSIHPPTLASLLDAPKVASPNLDRLNEYLTQLKQILAQIPNKDEAQNVFVLLTRFLVDEANGRDIPLSVHFSQQVTREITARPTSADQQGPPADESTVVSRPSRRRLTKKRGQSSPRDSDTSEDPHVSELADADASSCRSGEEMRPYQLRSRREKNLTSASRIDESPKDAVIATIEENTSLEESTSRLERDPTPRALIRAKVDGLIQEILAIEVHLSRPTKTGNTVLRFNLAEVKALLGCILQEVMGLQGLERLNTLISDYKAVSPDGADTGAATRAERVAKLNDTPLQARPLFVAYGHLERALSNEGTQLKSFRVLLARLEFMNAYHWLVRSVDDKSRHPTMFNPSLSQQFRDLGWKPTPGCDWKTVIRNYLADKLQVEKQTIATRLNHSAGLHQMAHHFGQPIICLIPDSIVKRIKYWNLQKMELVWPLIIEKFPIFRDMIKWLEVHVFDKIRQGVPLEIDTIRLEDTKPIYQLMLDAADSADVQMSGT